LLERFKNPPIRARIKKDLAGDHPDWGKPLQVIAAAVRGYYLPA